MGGGDPRAIDGQVRTGTKLLIDRLDKVFDAGLEFRF